MGHYGRKDGELKRLRAEAESAAMRRRPDRPAGPDASDPERLIHELEVHQVELELQNEELRTTQAALVESRDRYYELYDLAPVGYLALDRSGTIHEANLAAAALLGTDRARLAGRGLPSLLEQDDADALYRHLGDVFARGTKHGCDLVLRAGRGPGMPDTPVHIDSIAVAESDGTRTRCRSVLIDLSALRSAEETSRTWQARDKTLLDTAPDAIVSSDVAGRIVAFNKAAERLFGYTEPEVLGQNVRMLMPAPYREAHERYIERYVSTGEAQIIGRPNREVTARRKDGTTFPVELGIGEWRDRDERRFTAILHDLTERKRAELRLRESEKRFRTMADSAPVLLWMADPSGQRTFFNRGWLEYTGDTIEEALGDGWTKRVHLDDYRRCIRAIQDAMAARRPFQVEYRLRRMAGADGWVFDTGQPRWTADGAFAGYIGAAIDISEMKTLEEELRQAQKMEAVGALATGVAHDFGNVLQAVLGCVNVARKENVSRQRAIEYLERAADAARHGGRLAGQLMAFARKQRADPQPIEIDAVIQSVAKLVERLVTEQVAVTIRPGARGALVLADPVQLEQIVMNLGANARDAMPGGGSLSIRTDILAADDPRLRRCAPEPTADHVRLIVQDSGAGMDERTRRRIFEPFFTTKEVGEGTGLGLSTVFAITKQLGGHVDVESELGRGTTFRLCFPVCGQVSESMRPRPRETPRFSGTALLVEDDPLVRLTVRHYLEDLGLAVLEAENAGDADAQCALQRNPVDLLVADVVLPVMRGPDLAARLQARHPGLRVLLMSASPEYHAEGEAATLAHPVLHKPFGKEELGEQLKALLPDLRVDRGSTPPPDPCPDTERGPPRDRGQPSGPGQPRTILIVEDEETSREALAELLESEGYRVRAAAAPSQALAVAEREARIDVVISDLRLPEMPGDELARRLRAYDPRIQVILMSGLTEPPESEAIFVQKPIDFDALVEVIEQTLSKAPGQST